MARQKPTDEIQTLRKQREQLDARLKAAEGRQKEKDRQDDQRRKAIAGALALEHAAANPHSEFTRLLSDLLDKRISRPLDRALFPALLCPTESKDARLNSSHTRSLDAGTNSSSRGPEA